LCLRRGFGRRRSTKEKRWRSNRALVLTAPHILTFPCARILLGTLLPAATREVLLAVLILAWIQIQAAELLLQAGDELVARGGGDMADKIKSNINMN
jgi:hypothetical protein